METVNTPLDQFLDMFDALSSEELERVEKRLASVCGKKNGTPRIPTPTPAPVASDLFAISFDEYLAMPLEERHAIQISAYENHAEWIAQALEQFEARWILVCGGKVIESSPTLRNYPRREKVRAAGEKYSLMPFVFVKGPMIEESIWSVLPHHDSYPTLPITVAAENVSPSNLKANGWRITEADFDTGSPDILIDYDRLIEKKIIESQDIDDAHTHSHLEHEYRFHIVPILIGVVTETDKLITGIIDVFCVRDWAKSSLVFSESHPAGFDWQKFALRVTVTYCVGRPQTDH